MDIKNLNTPVSRATDSARTGANGQAGSPTQATPRPGEGSGKVAGREDAVTLTAAALDLASLVADPPFDRNRVDAIKDAIDRGHYVVDPERIARAIIDLDDF